MKNPGRFLSFAFITCESAKVAGQGKVKKVKFFSKICPYLVGKSMTFNFLN
jgi:hypothetical protein